MNTDTNEEASKLTEAKQTLGPFFKLPIEWLVQILDWLPTKTLFQVMRTNREWECGSRFVIKHRESLTLAMNPPDWKRLPCVTE